MHSNPKDLVCCVLSCRCSAAQWDLFKETLLSSSSPVVVLEKHTKYLWTSLTCDLPGISPSILGIVNILVRIALSGGPASAMQPTCVCVCVCVFRCVCVCVCVCRCVCVCVCLPCLCRPPPSVWEQVSPPDSRRLSVRWCHREAFLRAQPLWSLAGIN